MIVHGKISTAYPKDWNIDLLDKLSRRRTGHTPDKKHPEYYDDSFPWISLADSNMLDNIYIDETRFRISQLGLDNSSAVLLDEGTVVLSRDAGVGKSAIISQKMAVSQHFVTWTCSASLNNYYLYCCLQEAKPLFERMAVGSTIKTIGLPFFRKLKIGYPPLPTQNRIAAILQTWDRAIQLAEQQLEDLQTRKRGLMQLLLTGKKRLPEFEGQGEWEEVRISDVAKVKGGYAFKSTTYSEKGEYKIVTISAVQPEQFKIAGAPQIHTLPSDLQPHQLLQENDILVSLTGNVGRVCKTEKGQFVLNQRVGLVIPSKNIDDKFLYQVLSQYSFTTAMMRLAQGGAQGNISNNDILAYRISIPAMPEQLAVNKVLYNADKSISVLKNTISSLRLQKRGLMQRLLEGEVEVGEEMDEILGL